MPAQRLAVDVHRVALLCLAAAFLGWLACSSGIGSGLGHVHVRRPAALERVVLTPALEEEAPSPPHALGQAPPPPPHALGQAPPPPPHALGQVPPVPSPAPAPAPYAAWSRMHCIGGQQSFTNWTIEKVPWYFPNAHEPSLRTCMLHNVCIVNGSVVYHEDSGSLPQRATMEGIGTLLHAGYFTGPWQPVVVSSPRPRDLPVMSGLTYFLNFNSHSDNFGHLLMDDLVPFIAAAELWDVPLAQAQLLHNGCQQWHIPLWRKDAIEPLSKQPRWVRCYANRALWEPLVHGKRSIDLSTDLAWANRSVCVDRLVVGQARALSLAVLDLQRGNTLRYLSRTVATNLGIDIAAEPPRRQHSIVVLIKVHAMRVPSWPTVCPDVQAIAAGLRVPVTCLDPANVTLNETVRAVRSATVVVAEHGAVVYNALFAREGTSLVVGADVRFLKESHVVLFAAHLSTYYTDVRDTASLPRFLRTALDVASARLGLPMPET